LFIWLPLSEKDMILLETRTYVTASIGVANEGPGPFRPIFHTYSHFVLWEAVSQAKQCYSPKIKHFGPQSFVVATLLIANSFSKLFVTKSTLNLNHSTSSKCDRHFRITSVVMQPEHCLYLVISFDILQNTRELEAWASTPFCTIHLNYAHLFVTRHISEFHFRVETW